MVLIFNPIWLVRTRLSLQGASFNSLETNKVGGDKNSVKIRKSYSGLIGTNDMLLGTQSCIEWITLFQFSNDEILQFVLVQMLFKRFTRKREYEDYIAE